MMRDDFNQLRYIMKNADKLPEELYESLIPKVSKLLNEFDELVEEFLKKDLDLSGKHTSEDFKNAISFTIRTKKKESIRNYMLKCNDRHRYEGRGKACPLRVLCQGPASDEKRNLNNLKKLWEMGYFKKEDVVNRHLIGNALKLYYYYIDDDSSNEESHDRMIETSRVRPNELSFTYLLELNPDALKRGTDLTPLEEVIDYHSFVTHQNPVSMPYRHYDSEEFDHYHINNNITSMIKLILKAALKHHPYGLGLLFQNQPYYILHDRDRYRGETAFVMACGRSEHDEKYYHTRSNQEQSGWDIIKECLEEVNDQRILEQNPKTGLYPFMLVAADKISSFGQLEFLYYLLRKEPSVLQVPPAASSLCYLGSKRCLKMDGGLGERKMLKCS